MIRRVLILMVRAYQVVFSPLFGSCCRYYPSCSTYCIEAIEKHGCVKGMWLGILRLCRCHPFHPGGPDPVPEPSRNPGAHE